MNDSKAKDDMDQLKKKTRELEVVAAMCKVDAGEALEDIAVSVETTNKLTPSLHYNDETINTYLQWWCIFFKEWSYRCFIRWINKFGDSKDYELMKNSWYIFEILWVVGCNVVRLTRLNELRTDVSGIIERELPSKEDENAVWQWIDSLDETAVKAIDSFKGKQRQAFEQVLEELKGYDKASLLGKLRRIISTY